jgi:hypothetical protein
LHSLVLLFFSSAFISNQITFWQVLSLLSNDVANRLQEMTLSAPEIGSLALDDLFPHLKGYLERTTIVGAALELLEKGGDDQSYPGLILDSASGAAKHVRPSSGSPRVDSLLLICFS